MEINDLPWTEIEDAAKIICEDDFDLLENEQIRIIEELIKNDQQPEAFFTEHGNAFKLDISGTIEIVKLSLELVVVIWGLLEVLRESADTKNTLIEIKKNEKTKKLKLMIGEIDDDTLESVINILKAYRKK
jgi:hypothetical protein